MFTGNVQRCNGVEFPYLCRTTRLSSFRGVKYPERFFFITPEPREVSRQNFGPVNKITLEIFLGQNRSHSISSAHVKMTDFETWPYITDLSQYLTFFIHFLVDKAGTCCNLETF